MFIDHFILSEKCTEREIMLGIYNEKTSRSPGTSFKTESNIVIDTHKGS